MINSDRILAPWQGSPASLIRRTAPTLTLALFLGAALSAQTNTFPASGNVGIGTTSPVANLAIVNNTNGSVQTMQTWFSPRSWTSQQDGLQFVGYGGILGTHDYGSIVMRSDPTNGDGGRAYFDMYAGGSSSTRANSSLFLRAYATMGSVINDVQFFTNSNPRMIIDSGGNVGIGTTNPTYPLSVNGAVQAKEVLVSTGWSDYVFGPGYRLQPLSEVAAFVQANHHLPDIPSEAEVKEKGVNLGEMQAKLLAKVEELTLHMIEADKRIEELARENKELKKQLSGKEKP